MECIARAKNTSVEPDRHGLMIRSEKLCEGNLATSLLERKLVLMQLSQIAKTVQLFGLKKVEKRHAGTWLSRSPLTKIGNCRYAWLIRPCITRETRVSSLVVDSGPCYHPLLYTGNENGNGSEN